MDEADDMLFQHEWSDAKFGTFSFDAGMVSEAVAVARKSQRQALVDQILAIQQVVNLAHAAAKVTPLLGDERVAKHMIQKDKLPIVTELRRQLGMYRNQFQENFVSHIDSDDTLQLPVKVSTLADSICKQAERVLTSVIQMWSEDVTALGASLTNLAPNWQPYKDVLLSNHALANELTSCANFGQINQHAQILDKMIIAMKALNADGHGLAFGPKVLKEATDHKSFAVDTVCTAFALAQWRMTIEVQVNHMQRCTLIKNLEDEIAQRGSVLPEDLLAALEEAKKTGFKVKRPAEAARDGVDGDSAAKRRK